MEKNEFDETLSKISLSVKDCLDISSDDESLHLLVLLKLFAFYLSALDREGILKSLNVLHKEILFNIEYYEKYGEENEQN